MKKMFRIVLAVLLLFAWAYLHQTNHRYIMPPTPLTTVPDASATPLQYNPSPTPTIKPVLASQ